MHKLKFLLLMLIAASFMGIQSTAQCVSAPDGCGNPVITMPTTAGPLCPGSIYTFTPTINWSGLSTGTWSWAPAGVVNTSVSTSGGITTLSSRVTVAAIPRTYCLTATATGPDIIMNGNFATAGTTCFTSDYIPACPAAAVGTYTVTSNANIGYPLLGVNFPDRSGTNNMLFANGSTVANDVVWRQTVNVCSSSLYDFEAYYANWSDPTGPNPVGGTHAPVLFVRIIPNVGPTVVQGPYSSPTSAATWNWQQIRFNWNSGGATSATIEIYDTDLTDWWNDFALDDISMRRIVTEQKCITVIPHPTPNATITGPTCTPVCVGQPITITFTGTPGIVNYNYSWPIIASPYFLSQTGSITIPSTGSITHTFTAPSGPRNNDNFSIRTTSVTGPCGTVPLNQLITVRIEDPTATLSVVPAPCANTTFSVTVTGTRGSVVTFTGTTAGGTTTYTANIPTTAPYRTTVGIPGGISGATTYCITSVSTCSCTKTGPFPCLTVTPVLPPIPPTMVATGSPTVCVGTMKQITITSGGGGAWSVSGSPIATLVLPGMPPRIRIVGVTAGISVISYTLSNSCGTAAATYTVTVVAPPVVGPITAPLAICVGTPHSISCSPAGGVWSYIGVGSANITPVSSPGATLTGTGAGAIVLRYTVANTCGTVTATKLVRVQNPVTATITGATTVCQGNIIPLTATPPGGTWSQSSPGVATIIPLPLISRAIVYGATAGTTVVTYSTRGNTCGSATATHTVTVLPQPTVGAINSPTVICAGASATISCSPAGGVWSSLGAINVVSAMPGVATITGMIPGIGIIYYTVANSCGTVTATSRVRVAPIPAPVIRGPRRICTGVNVSLSYNIGGGTWTSSNTNVATVHPGTGIITGITGGTTVITYSVTNIAGCTGVATWTVTVNPTPVISGATSICPGSNTTLTTTISGGAWSSSDNSLATVDASGTVFHVSGGSVTITYTTPAGCTKTYAMNMIDDLHICPAYNYGTGQFDIPQPFVTGITSINYQTGYGGGGTGGFTWNPAVTCTTPPCHEYPWGLNCVQINSYTYQGCALTHPCTVCVNPVYRAAHITGPTSVCPGASATYVAAPFYPGGHYQWYLNSGSGFNAVSGANDTVYTYNPNDSDALAYTVMDLNGITASDTIWIDTLCLPKAANTSGIADQYTQLNNLKLSPNPNHGTFTINGKVVLDAATKELQIEVCNLLGQTVYKNTAYLNNNLLNATVKLDDSFPNSVYLVRIMYNGTMRSIRFTLNR